MAAHDAGENEDERLEIEAARRDPSRFARLYEANVDRVFAFAARRLPSRAEAEDATAEVFRKALAGLARYEWQGTPFLAWLYRIAANEIADRRRASARARLAAPIDEGSVPAVVPSAERDLDEARRRDCVEHSIDDLPADQRRVVRMRFFEERTVKEIAGDIGRSEGAVKQLQFRALASLKARCGGGRSDG